MQALEFGNLWSLDANEKLDIVYEIVEAQVVQPSHTVGFDKNPQYTLENERRYHVDTDAQGKVVT